MTQATNLLQFVQSSKSNEWYTPPVYVEAARQVMGTIDLDPASCPKAQQTVNAASYFTIEDNGLAQPWGSFTAPVNLFGNPPYGYEGGWVKGQWSDKAGRPNQDIWTAKLLKEHEIRRVCQAVWLLTAATDADRFKVLFPFLVCLTDHRIKFIGPDGKPVSGNTKGSAFIYLPPRVDTQRQNDRFAQVFGQFGNIVTLYK